MPMQMQMTMTMRLTMNCSHCQLELPQVSKPENITTETILSITNPERHMRFCPKCGRYQTIRTITIEEYIEESSISRNAITARIRKGKIKGIKNGRKWTHIELP